MQNLGPQKRPHAEAWRAETEDVVLNEYILRCRGQKINDFVAELVKSGTYSCDDPKLHERSRAEFERRPTAAKEKLEIIDEYIQDRKMPYCLVNHALAGAYLGAGDLLRRDTEFPGWLYSEVQ